MNGVVPEDLEVLPVGFEQAEMVIVGDGVVAPGFGRGLEPSHEDGPLFLGVTSEIYLLVRVPQRRYVLWNAHLVGHQPHVLRRVQGNVDPRAQSKLPRPHPRRAHDDLALDVPTVRRDPRYRAVLAVHAGNLHVFYDACATDLRPPRDRQRRAGRDRVAVLRDVCSSLEVVRPHERPHRTGVLSRDLVNLDAVASAERQDPLELVHAVVRRRDRQASRRAESSRDSGLLVQGGIELRAHTVDVDHRPRGTELCNQSRGVPGRAARDRLAFQYHHVAPPQLRQVVRDAAPHDAPADDDHSRPVRNVVHDSRLRLL